MEKRPTLGVGARVTQTTGTAEREAAVAIAEAIAVPQRAPLSSDTHGETRDFGHELREL
jgi:hypothetical protein